MTRVLFILIIVISILIAQEIRKISKDLFENEDDEDERR